MRDYRCSAAAVIPEIIENPPAGYTFSAVCRYADVIQNIGKIRCLSSIFRVKATGIELRNLSCPALRINHTGLFINLFGHRDTGRAARLCLFLMKQIMRSPLTIYCPTCRHLVYLSQFKIPSFAESKSAVATDVGGSRFLQKG